MNAFLPKQRFIFTAVAIALPTGKLSSSIHRVVKSKATFSHIVAF